MSGKGHNRKKNTSKSRERAYNPPNKIFIVEWNVDRSENSNAHSYSM